MPDWNGLLAWSTKYHDGTKPSEFKPMSDEDKKWLTEAMKAYTFDDTNKMKTTCEYMIKDIESGFTMEGAQTIMEDLEEIIEIHERNSTNLARSGGLASLINY